MSSPMSGSGKATYDDAKFEAAFQSVLQMNKRDYPSYIDGLMIASGNVFPVDSPIDSSVRFGLFQEPEAGISERVVEASLGRYSEWSRTSGHERAVIFEKVLDDIKVQRYRLAAIVMLSTGMTRKESIAEVDRLIEILEAECPKAKDLKGRSLGPWGIISSHNSPLASPAGLASAAMLGGNTVVVMPSKYCPVPVYIFYDILERAGLPAGVMNLVTDRKDETYETLANDSRLAGVAVSGSGKNVEDMIFLQVDDELRFINELKGMNPIIIHRPSDNEKAVDDVISSAFSYSGQRLYSTSKVIIVADSQQRFMDTLNVSIKDIVIGDPAEKDVFAGPLISEAGFKRFNETIIEEKDNLTYGGKRITTDFTTNGYYVSPALFIGVDEENDLSYMDRGLPVLCMKIVNDFEAALEELANTECGLSAGIFSKDQKAIAAFTECANAPMLFMNESSVNLKPAMSAEIVNFVR